MYFKCLELVGFKSFAERTVIGFEPGITAIVGPNGCGKSNVSDAIRWVLGEQSARSLRGGLMEDLIFAGSAKLDPLGMAEVHLTLGNAKGLTDGQRNEVTVSRRLFRSGESQYFLNKQPCRLKDVHKVFMDTGLGTQSYSYVQQGSIELILSSRPEDRRFLFDETAGISKYKAEKKEALRRLEGTESNLLRLGDLIREVKRQIISIQRHAGKAHRYKELADELQGLEVGFLLHKRAQFAKEMKSLEKERDAVQEVIRRLAAEVEEREARARQARAELQSSQLRHEELQSRKLDLLRSIDRESGNISLHEQRIADTRSLAENVSAEIRGMQQKAAALRSAISEKQKSLDKLCQDRANCTERLKKREDELEGTLAQLRKSEAKSGDLSGRLLDVIRRETEIRASLSSLNERHGHNEQTLATLRRQKGETLAALQQKEQEHHARQQNKEALSLQLRSEKDELAALRAGLKETQDGLQNIRTEIFRAEAAVSGIGSERRFLAEAVERHEGYDAGVQSVIQESHRKKSQLTGIVGTVADVLDVSPGHEAIVEAALDNRVQWILTETTEDAKRAAGFLRDKARGRATFLPLDVVRDGNGARDAARNLSDEKGSVFPPLLDAVSFEPRYQKAVEYLLGDTVLVADLEQAVALAAESNSALTFVAPSGEKLEKGFVLTAGKVSSSSPGFMGRKSRIAALAAEEEKQREMLNDLRARENNSIEAVKSLTEKSEEQTALISRTEERLAIAGRDLLDLSAAVQSLTGQANETTARENQTESEQKRLEDQRKSLGEENRVVGDQHAELERAISFAGATVDSAEKDVASIKRDVAEIALAKGSYDERIANLQNEMEYMRGQLDLTEREVESRARQTEQGKTQISNLLREVEECRKAIASLTTQKDEVTTAIEKLDEKRRAFVDELTQLEWEIKEKTNAAHEREKEISALDLKLTEIRFSMNSIDERLMAEYALRHDDPKAVPLPDETDWRQIQERVGDLKQKLQLMGPVNLCAIEEYETLKNRYDFLTAQQSDMVEARESLHKAIARLDRESKVLFRDTFEKIREEFQTMFQRLFGGGRADLVLVDESDILESGIEIIARPPGKKLQSISLLSGGERAMTAISLLFAIFKVKPSPFCILDEIDAPLDDSNIMRFAEVLREFARNSQFIIITHNKRTIAASDVLYGITMEESGKSKVVSAKLTRGRGEASVRRAEASPEFSAEAAVAPASN